MWREITENNYRHIHSKFGLNIHDTVDSMGIEDIVNLVHLRLINNPNEFHFKPPYDKNPPLALIIESCIDERVYKYRREIIAKVSLYTNMAVRNKVIDLHRRGTRLEEVSEESIFLSLDGEILFSHLHKDEFINLVSDHREVLNIIKFLDSSTEISKLEKSILTRKIEGDTAQENAEYHGVTRHKVNNTLKKVKDYIVRALKA